ncbi:hypothetical protein Bca52824_085770 [Brassica carinata]|uniref:Sodium/calcium exchanger membrane region domain-containing protein n=1 Tax=Brassica carinata TaxID=52824 RepID=A0A8X7P8E6_BRACI|nr:hypothetical protein Bca52824_085770 [Brassica carinata]
MSHCNVPALIEPQVEMGSVDEAEHKTLFKLEEDAKQTKEASLMEQGSLSPIFPQHITKSPKNSVLKSIKIVILSNKLNLLLPFGPLAILVHYGWMMGEQMDLNFQLFETAMLFITVIVVAFFLQEGTSNYFKGLMLILCYLIVAASFFVHEDPQQDGAL